MEETLGIAIAHCHLHYRAMLIITVPHYQVQSLPPALAVQELHQQYHRALYHHQQSKTRLFLHHLHLTMVIYLVLKPSYLPPSHPQQIRPSMMTRNDWVGDHIIVLFSPLTFTYVAKCKNLIEIIQGDDRVSQFSEMVFRLVINDTSYRRRKPYSLESQMMNMRISCSSLTKMMRLKEGGCVDVISCYT